MENKLTSYAFMGFLIIILVLINGWVWAQEPGEIPFGESGKGEQGIRSMYINEPYVTPVKGYGYRLNYCLKRNSLCGKPAADTFCQIVGYKFAISFERDNCDGQFSYFYLDKSGCNAGNASCFCFQFIECSE